MDTIPIQFYLPIRSNNSNASILPERTADYWDWQCKTVPQSGFLGQYHWVVQTYLFLKEFGLNCEFRTTFPASGVVVTHRDHLSEKAYSPNRKLTIVCLQVDRGSFPFAQFHVVHSRLQENLAQRKVYLAPWPQISLVPRESGRGTIVKNVSYVGDLANLAPELCSPSWDQELASRGFNWIVRERERWNDFSNLDVILAVRSFDPAKQFGRKPALKLFNAWHAGVPAVLGSEVSYQLERSGPLDFIEVTSVQDALEALERLRCDSKLFTSIVGNGLKRAEATSPAQLAETWKRFFSEQVIPFHHRQGLGFVLALSSKKLSWWFKQKQRGLKQRVSLSIDEGQNHGKRGNPA